MAPDSWLLKGIAIALLVASIAALFALAFTADSARRQERERLFKLEIENAKLRARLELYEEGILTPVAPRGEGGGGGTEREEAR